MPSSSSPPRMMADDDTATTASISSMTVDGGRHVSSPHFQTRRTTTTTATTSSTTTEVLNRYSDARAPTEDPDSSSSSFVDSLSGLGFADALGDGDSSNNDDMGFANALSDDDGSSNNYDDNCSVDSMEERQIEIAEEKTKARAEHLWGVMAPTGIALGTVLLKVVNDGDTTVVNEDDAVAAAVFIKESSTGTAAASPQ